MTGCDFSWPEQDIIDAWVEKHGLTIDRKVLRELKDDVTRYRKSAKYLADGPLVLTKGEMKLAKELCRRGPPKVRVLSKLNRVRERSKWNV